MGPVAGAIPGLALLLLITPRLLLPLLWLPVEGWWVWLIELRQP